MGTAEWKAHSSNAAGDDLTHAFTGQAELVRDLVKRATLFAEGRPSRRFSSKSLRPWFDFLNFVWSMAS
jgi:hypothetical protein